MTPRPPSPEPSSGWRRCAFILVAVFAGAVLASPVPDVPQDPVQHETIQLTINVKTVAGLPIPNAPFEAASLYESGFLMTDSGGQAIFTIDKLVDETSILVRLTHGGFTSLVPPELRAVATPRFHALSIAHAFRPCYLIAVTGGGPYTADIVAKPAVTISGRILGVDGQPKTTNLAPRSSNTYDIIWDNELGVFSVGGVTKGEAGELWIAGAINQMYVVHLTASQLQTDLKLGDLVIEDTPRDAVLTIQMTNFAGLAVASKMTIRDGVSLIAKDDAELHVFGADRDDGELYTTDLDGKRTSDLSIPAGTYYLVPGGFGSESSFALLEAVRAGRQALLDTAGVPKVTVASGATVSFGFDAQVALDAVMATGGDLVCPCGCN